MKTKGLIIAGIILFFALGWGSLLNKAATLPIQYETDLLHAREQRELKCYKNSIDLYNSALELKSSDIAVHIELANVQKLAGNENAFVSIVSDLKNQFLRNPLPYETLIGHYLEKKDYEKCAVLLYEAQERDAYSELLSNIQSDMRYQYDFSSTAYDDVSYYSFGLCGVYNGKSWGYVGSDGKKRIKPKFEIIGAFSKSGFAPAMVDGEWFYIDEEGARVKSIDMPIDELGYYSGDTLFSFVSAGSAHYLTSDFKNIKGDYLFSGAYNGGIAAIQDSLGWKLINTEQQQVGSEVFDRIILDEKGICFRNDTILVEKDGLVYFADQLGQVKQNISFEDAYLFMSDQPTAVKLNEKWGFADSKGTIVIDYQYDDARPFINGLAAVKQGDEWGYIDLDNTIAIQPQYQDVRPFGEKGTAFVKTGGKWHTIRFYSSMIGKGK